MTTILGLIPSIAKRFVYRYSYYCDKGCPATRTIPSEQCEQDGESLFVWHSFKVLDLRWFEYDRMSSFHTIPLAFPLSLPLWTLVLSMGQCRKCFVKIMYLICVMDLLGISSKLSVRSTKTHGYK